MPTYILKSTDSDLTGGADFSKEISGGTQTTSSITVSVAAGATETSYGFSKANVPSNNKWETGGLTVEVNVTTANTNIFLSVSASRVNSVGTAQEETTTTTEQQLSTTGVKTFSIASYTWAAGNCGDRLRINYKFRNSASHGANSVVIETGTTNTEVVTSIAEVAPGCTIPLDVGPQYPVKYLQSRVRDHIKSFPFFFYFPKPLTPGPRGIFAQSTEPEKLTTLLYQGKAFPFTGAEFPSDLLPKWHPEPNNPYLFKVGVVPY